MYRRHRADKREILPDPKFGNVVVTKFMNSVMHAGKKSVAETIVYGALDMIDQGQGDEKILCVGAAYVGNYAPIGVSDAGQRRDFAGV